MIMTVLIARSASNSILMILLHEVGYMRWLYDHLLISAACILQSDIH